MDESFLLVVMVHEARSEKETLQPRASTDRLRENPAGCQNCSRCTSRPPNGATIARHHVAIERYARPKSCSANKRLVRRHRAASGSHRPSTTTCPREFRGDFLERNAVRGAQTGISLRFSTKRSEGSSRAANFSRAWSLGTCSKSGLLARPSNACSRASP